MSKKLLLGAHTSAAGGAHNALLEGKSIGATTIQFFTSNQRQWHGRALSQDELALWTKALEASAITDVMSHSSYLINLGSPDEELLQKSLKAFQEEIERCHLFGVSFLNFHPGVATDGHAEKCLETIVNSILSFEALLGKGETRLLLETTAGQGKSVGHTFEQIGFIVERTKGRVPIGVCIDTCHIFAAGYDIRTDADWEKVLQEFDEKIGLEHLNAFHINDSLKDLGSRVDRHASLGKGKIGLDCFRFLMTHPKTAFIPKYLETPEGPEVWKQEILLLRQFHEEK